MPIMVGETIGAYRIIEQLGQGGMATVFKAYHSALDRYVAIKALHPAFKEDKNFQARFQREARVVARLDHPNIVPVYDFSEYEARPYLVMKYIEGETLKARLIRKQLSIEEIMQITEAVGSALTYAHRQGILHRDIKPSNVLLSQDGQIYLADFGLARIAAAGESTISSDMMLGTPQYISPEQAMGKRDLDEGTDIYSFGVLLYELIVGQVPFSADTPYAIIHDHIYSPLPLPSTIKPGLSEAIERVLLKALAKDRSDRYPTVAALVESFRDAAQELTNSTTQGQTDSIPTLINAPPVPESNAFPTPQPIMPVDEKVVDEIPIPVEPNPASPQASPEKTKPAKKPWLRRWYAWLMIAAVVFWICAAALLGIGVLRKNRTLANQPVLTNTPTQRLTNNPTDAIQAARQRMLENQNDPMAHLELAALLIDVRQYDEVLSEMNKVADLVNEPGFYLENGRRFVEQQKWVAAAWAFLRYMEVQQGTTTPDIIDLWHESVYKAFNDVGAARVIDIERIRSVDPVIAGVAHAEADLAAGNPIQADADILVTLKQNDNSKEALLVQAHVLAVRNFPERARNILNTLSQTELPPWIRDEITHLQKTQNLNP